MQNVDKFPANVDVERVFSYLDDLRASGAVNMFGSSEWIQSEFHVGPILARNLVIEWMQTFVDRSRRDQE